MLANPDKYERRFKGLKPQTQAEEKSAKRTQYWDLSTDQKQKRAWPWVSCCSMFGFSYLC